MNYSFSFFLFSLFWDRPLLNLGIECCLLNGNQGRITTTFFKHEKCLPWLYSSFPTCYPWCSDFGLLEHCYRDPSPSGQVWSCHGEEVDDPALKLVSHLRDKIPHQTCVRWNHYLPSRRLHPISWSLRRKAWFRLLLVKLHVWTSIELHVSRFLHKSLLAVGNWHGRSHSAAHNIRSALAIPQFCFPVSSNCMRWFNIWKRTFSGVVPLFSFFFKGKRKKEKGTFNEAHLWWIETIKYAYRSV